jgi:hypothetical protein
MDVSFLQKNYILVVVSVVFSVILTFFLNLALPQKQEDRTYIKSILVSGIVSAVMIYIHNLDIPVESISLEPVPF